MTKIIETYNWLSRQFHWFTVPLIIAAFSLGFVMTELPLSTLQLTLFAWHKWIGLTILGLLLLRLLWRFVSRQPNKPESANVPHFIHTLSKLGHGALYLLLFLVPTLGWLRSSTAGFEIKLFEVIKVPDLLAKNEELSKQLAELHEWGAWALLILLIGHVGAVIVHHGFWKDPVLQKMRPSFAHKSIVFLSFLAGLGFAANTLILNPPKSEEGQQTAKGQQPKPQTLEMKDKQETAKQGKWRVVKEVSKLEFTATQKGAATTGTFKSYEIAELTFKASEPEQASVTVKIDVGSLFLGNTLIEQTLASGSWFNVGEFPTAIFKAKGFEPRGENKYNLNGTLTIKGLTKPVTIELVINEDGEKKQIKAKGSTTISRLAYQVGQGEWASTETLADEVKLTIDVTAIKQQ